MGIFIWCSIVVMFYSQLLQYSNIAEMLQNDSERGSGVKEGRKRLRKMH